MPYANMDVLSRDWRQAEGGEGNFDDGGDNKLVDGRVRGPRWEDTGDGQQWSSRRNGDNDNKDKEGGLHPTSWTMVTCKLVARMRSAGSGQGRERAR